MPNHKVTIELTPAQFEVVSIASETAEILVEELVTQVVDGYVQEQLEEAEAPDDWFEKGGGQYEPARNDK